MGWFRAILFTGLIAVAVIFAFIAIATFMLEHPDTAVFTAGFIWTGGALFCAAAAWKVAHDAD